MRKLGGFLLLSSLLLFGCSGNAPLQEEALLSLELVAEENRFYSEHSFDELPLYDFSNNSEEELPNEILQSLRIVDGDESQVLTVEGMIEDINVLHLTLKHMYPLYEYMGGDERFKETRDNLIEHLLGLEEGTELSEFQFVNLLKNRYDFIVDTHFSIGESPMADFQYSFYMSDHYSFYKNENGEFELVGSENTRLIAVNNDDDVDSYLKATINAEGEIVYIPGILSTYLTSSEREWELRFEDSQIERIALRAGGKVLPNYQLGSRMAFIEKEGIPWLQMRSMFVLENDPFDYYDIIDTAAQLKSEPYFVLDLRGNQGGSIILVDKWMEEFFDAPVSWNSKFVQLISNTSLTFLQDTIDIYKKHGVSSQTFDDGFTHLSLAQNHENLKEPKWEIEEKPFNQYVDNDTHIFVLVDNNTASAAEHFVTHLKQVNNTTVIGVNTMGSVISGNSLMWKLPNTKIEMFVPTFFNYNPDLLDKEAIGIQPDLWVNPDQVEQRIFTFIERYAQ